MPNRLILHIFFAFLAVYSLAILYLTPTRGFDPDEFEHIQAAWLISTGQVPFRDFFEHHTPIWHLIAALLLPSNIFPDYPWATKILMVARYVSVLISAGIAVITWNICRRFAGSTAAWISVMLLSVNSVFMAKAIEIRPDPLSTLGIVASVYALQRLQEDHQQKSFHPLLWASIAGAAQAVAVLASQKAAFSTLGLAVAFLWITLPKSNIRQIIKLLLCVSAGVLSVVTPLMMWLYVHDALGDFVHFTLLIHIGWLKQSRPAIAELFYLIVRYDTIPLSLAVLGLSLVVWDASRRRMPPVLVAVLFPMASLIVGLKMLPVFQGQYYFMILPFLSILGGFAALRILDFFKTSTLRNAAVVGATLLLTVSAARSMELVFHRSNRDTLAKLQYLLNSVPPDATVMGGWSTGIAFRKPAWFYYFPHDEVMHIIPQQSYSDLTNRLNDGTVRPAMIDVDQSILRMPPDFLDFVHLHYVPTGVSTLHMLRPRRRRSIRRKTRGESQHYGSPPPAPARTRAARRSGSPAAPLPPPAPPASPP